MFGNLRRLRPITKCRARILGVGQNTDLQVTRRRITPGGIATDKCVYVEADHSVLSNPKKSIIRLEHVEPISATLGRNCMLEHHHYVCLLTSATNRFEKLPPIA
jgi:hypothetical protein